MILYKLIKYIGIKISKNGLFCNVTIMICIASFIGLRVVVPIYTGSL